MDLLDSSDEEEAHRTFAVSRSPSQEDLLPLLECPVCFDLPLPPIRTCLQGHILCADCCPKLHACPLCLQPIGFGRNFFAEDFINKSMMTCKFRNAGCTFETTGALIRAHTVNCDYRPLKCLHCQGASRRVTYATFERHLHLEHAISQWDITDGGDRVIEIEKSQAAQQTVVGVQAKSTSSTPRFIFRSLLALGFGLFLADQIRSNFYPDSACGILICQDPENLIQNTIF